MAGGPRVEAVSTCAIPPPGLGSTIRRILRRIRIRRTCKSLRRSGRRMPLPCRAGQTWRRTRSMEEGGKVGVECKSTCRKLA